MPTLFADLATLRTLNSTDPHIDRELKSKLKAAELLIQQPDVTDIAITLDRFAKYDILVMSAGTRTAIELKARSKEFEDHYLEAIKLDGFKTINRKIQHVIYMAMTEGKENAFLWPLGGWTGEHERWCSKSQREPEKRVLKRFVSYPTSSAQVIKAKA